MIRRSTVRFITIIADMTSLLILAYLILKVYLFDYANFKMLDTLLTIIPLLIVKVGEMMLEKYKR